PSEPLKTTAGELLLGAPWTEAQEAAVQEALEQRTPIWANSLELPQWRRQPIESIFSPLGGPEWKPHDFRLKVDAEVIIYGATDPTATVTLAGHNVELRPDGTFSCRLALPDGQ